MISTSKIALVGALVALAKLQVVAAHGSVLAITIDDNVYAGFNPSNPPMYGLSPEVKGSNADQGFVNYNSSILAMNAPDGVTADFHAAASAGSKVTWFWSGWPDSHLGPITTHMAACPSTGCSTFAGNEADDWFKVGEYGYDSAGKWATSYLTADNAFSWEFTMPSDLPGGYYALRHELIAMHSNPSPQMYPIVTYIYLTSSGTATPSPTGSFPAMYGPGHNDALNFTLYYAAPDDPYLFSDATKFVVPGEALYSTAAVGNNGPGPSGNKAPTGTPITTDAGPGGAVSVPSPDGTAPAVSSGAVSSAMSSSAAATGGSQGAPSTTAGQSSVVKLSEGAGAATASISSGVPTSAAPQDGSPTTMASATASGTCKPKSTVTVTVTAN